MVKLSDIELKSRWATAPDLLSGELWFTNNYGVSVIHNRGTYEVMVMKRSLAEIGRWDIVVHPQTKKPLIQVGLSAGEAEDLMTEIETFKVGEM